MLPNSSEKHGIKKMIFLGAPQLIENGWKLRRTIVKYVCYYIEKINLLSFLMHMLTMLFHITERDLTCIVLILFKILKI